MNNCFSIYQTNWITRGPKSNFIYDDMPTKAILFFFGCSEVNSTLLITSELANQRAQKALFTCVVYTNMFYYMASSASGQDEPNHALWLATRVGKMEPSCRSGLPAVSRKQNLTKSHIINPLLTKSVRSRWLDIGLVLFLRVYGPRTWPISSHLDLTLGQ